MIKFEKQRHGEIVIPQLSHSDDLPQVEGGQNYEAVEAPPADLQGHNIPQPVVQSSSEGQMDHSDDSQMNKNESESRITNSPELKDSIHSDDELTEELGSLKNMH